MAGPGWYIQHGADTAMSALKEKKNLNKDERTRQLPYRVYDIIGLWNLFSCWSWFFTSPSVFFLFYLKWWKSRFFFLFFSWIGKFPQLSRRSGGTPWREAVLFSYFNFWIAAAAAAADVISIWWKRFDNSSQQKNRQINNKNGYAWFAVQISWSWFTLSQFAGVCIHVYTGWCTCVTARTI